MVLRKVLQLYQATGPSAGTVRSVELEHTVGTSVSADSVLHCLIFLHTAFGKLLTEDKSILYRLFIRCFDKLLHGFLVQGFRFHSVIGEPFLHLLHAVRIIKIGDSLHSDGQFFAGAFIKGDGVFHHGHIEGNAPVVDFLIEMIFIPYLFRDGVFCKAFLYRHFHFHVPAVVFLEADPFFAVMLWKVPGASAVCLCRLARGTEIPDQIFAFLQLLILQFQDGADSFQREGKSHVCGPDHCAFPG